MRLKIRCDEESWKILIFWVELNKALMEKEKSKEMKMESRNI